MSAPPDAPGRSILARGCLLSGVITILVIVGLKATAFRLPPLVLLLVAGALWIFIFMLVVRRATRP